MIRYLKHKEIDKKKWDACVEKASCGLPYACSWFLDIAAEEKWDGLVKGDYLAVMPLPFKKKLGLSFVYQPFFVQQLGVYGKADTTEFIRAIPPAFRHVHTLLNYSNAEVKGEKNVKEEVNLVLPLNKNYESIRKNYSENCKRNLKKVSNQPLEIRNTDAAELISVFRNTQGKKLPHLKTKNYAVLRQLITELGKRKLASTSGVYDKSGKLLGGMTMIMYRQRCIFFFSALTETGRKHSVNNFLLDQFIRDKADKDLLLDFEGSNSASLARFYKGFGAGEQNYFSYRSNKLPALLKLLKK